MIFLLFYFNFFFFFLFLLISLFFFVSPLRWPTSHTTSLLNPPNPHPSSKTTRCTPRSRLALHPLIEIEFHFKINPKSTTKKIQQRPPLYQETTTPPSCKPNIQNLATTTTPPNYKQQTQQPKSKSKVIQNNQITLSTQAQAHFQPSTTTPRSRSMQTQARFQPTTITPPQNQQRTKESYGE